MNVDSRHRVGALRPGDPHRLGAYRLTGRLGSGGMGVVYLARDPGGGPVAVKLVHANLAGDPEFRARFRSEVDRARQVPSFCTAEVLDADLDHQPPYLVVEYVDGPSLAEAVEQRGPLSPANLHSVAVGVATALAGIHGAGVIHRDLKPENVLLAPGSPKVIDFGIARAFEATSQHTRTDQFVGTVAYMAPERFASRPGTPLTAAADIFAWGCVIGYAGTGRTPFHGDSPPATAARILTQPPHLDGLAEPLRSLVRLALAKDPADRPTAPELLDLLVAGRPRTATVLPRPPARQVADPVPARPRRARGTRRQRPRGTRRLAALAVLLVLAGLGTVASVLDAPRHVKDALVAAEPRADGAAAGAPEQPSSPGPSAGDPPPTENPRLLPDAARAEPTGGEPIIRDPLDRPGLWLDSEIRAENANCVLRGAMRVTRAGRGAYQCAGPDEIIADDFAVRVTAALQSAGSCAAVWFHWDGDVGGHVARFCRDEVSMGAGMFGDRRVFGTLDLAEPLPLRRPIRMHLVVRGRSVDVFLDGGHAGTMRLPAGGPTEGQVQLGLIAEDRNDPTPYAVTFADVDIRSLGFD